MPSGNAITTQALYHLGYLCSETRYIDQAEATIQAASLNLAKQPISHTALLNAVDIKLRGATIIILRGEKEKMRAREQAIHRQYLPDTLCFPINDEITPSSPIDSKTPIEGRICAYICEGMSCQESITELPALEQKIKEINHQI